MRDIQPDGRTTWVIAHPGMGHGFVIDLVKAFGQETQLNVERLDPRTGDCTQLDRVLATAETRIETPSKGGVKHDWVFIFTP